MMYNNKAYTREDIIKMKQIVYTLQYNRDFNCKDDQRQTFNEVALMYPEIKDNINNNVLHEYHLRGMEIITKFYFEFDSTDIDIWTKCMINNLNAVIHNYENRYGVAYFELSHQFNNFINGSNKAINPNRLYVKGTQTLSVTQLIDTVAKVIEIGNLLTRKEIPCLDECLLGLKGINLALKERNGTITNKDKFGAGLDLMFYIANKSVRDKGVKIALGASSVVIGLCLEFFIGDM